MSISNNWSNITSRQDQALQRRMMRNDAATAMAGANGQTAQITITVGAPQQQGGGNGPGSQIQVGGASGRSGMMAMLNSANIGQMPPPPPPQSAADNFSNNVSALFDALESGDEDAATSAADALQSIIDSVEASSTQTSSDTTETSDSSSGEPDFITALKSILEAVSSGDFDTAKTEATDLADTIASAAPPRGPNVGGPNGGPPPMGTDVMSQLDDLMQAVSDGDMDTAKELATALREALPGLDDTTTTVATGESFDTDVAALLNSVAAGDADTAASDVETIMNALSQSGPMGRGPSDASSNSIDAALSSLNDLSSTESTTGTSFIDSLKDLLEALKSGSNIDQRLKSVIAAYTTDQTTTS